jgi:endonuclease/exonuclease/phosphatase family metal-dependent hydrolase
MRLLSYNIHKGIGGADRKYSLERIMDVIAGEHADLVCLQEVDFNVRRSRYDDQPALLVRELGAAAHFYQLNVPYQEGGYGNLLLSRWPLAHTRQVSLSYKHHIRRGAQLVVIDTPQGLLHLVNWHLGLAERERRWQASLLLDHSHFHVSSYLPTLITGDFNDWRNTLAKHCFHPHRFRHGTSPPGNFRSFPAFFPLASLDKVYYRGPLQLHEARVVTTRLSRRASDHLPLRVEFSLHA